MLIGYIIYLTYKIFTSIVYCVICFLFIVIYVGYLIEPKTYNCKHLSQIQQLKQEVDNRILKSK